MTTLFCQSVFIHLQTISKHWPTCFFLIKRLLIPTHIIRHCDLVCIFLQLLIPWPSIASSSTEMFCIVQSWKDWWPKYDRGKQNELQGQKCMCKNFPQSSCTKSSQTLACISIIETLFENHCHTWIQITSKWHAIETKIFLPLFCVTEFLTWKSLETLW